MPDSRDRQIDRQKILHFTLILYACLLLRAFLIARFIVYLLTGHSSGC